MPLTTGSSEIGTSGLRTQTMGLNVGTSYLGSGGVRTSSISSQTPYQAHVARMQAAAPNSSGYYTAQDYTASLSQAGKFVDAFGGSLTYTSPNVQASPTRVVDGTSGMAYVSSDGADDTAIGSTLQAVAAWCALIRSPQTTFNNYGAVIDERMQPSPSMPQNGRLGYFQQNGMALNEAGSLLRRNGVVLSAGASLAPITSWMTLTVGTGHPGASQVLQLFALENSYFVKLQFAALLLWPTAPSTAEVQAVEGEFASYYGPLIATNPA